MREIWYIFIIVAFVSRSLLLFYYSKRPVHRKDDLVYAIWFLILAASYAFYAATKVFPDGAIAEFLFDRALGAIVIATSTVEYIKILRRK